MSHELENANDMVYVGATPWHGLGDKVESIDVLPNCLNWHVEKRNLAIALPDGTFQPSSFKAMVRDDTGKELGVATDQYQPHQNEQLWQTFKEFCSAGNMTIETAGTLKGGRIVWILAKINKAFTIGRSDTQELYALIATAHDRSMNTISRPTVVRVVCWNTLTAALSDLSKTNGRNDPENVFRMSHRGKYNVSAAQDFVARSILGFEIFQAQAEKLIAVDLNGINRPLVSAFGSELVNPDLFTQTAKDCGLIDVSKEFGQLERKQLIRAIAERNDAARPFTEKIEAEANRPLKALFHDIRTEQDGMAGKTAWSLLQGATRYVDHTHGRTDDSRLASAWFGSGNNLKTKALDIALDYAAALAA